MSSNVKTLEAVAVIALLLDDNDEENEKPPKVFSIDSTMDVKKKN